MDRRCFLKIAALSSASAALLSPAPGAIARGIPAQDFPGGPLGKCYAPPNNPVILTTLTDLFKIGPGPSSSHTIAPLRIASNFRETVAALPAETLNQAQSIQAHLFGSLSATGRGHRTDRAILAGLMGQKPDTCDTALMDQLEDTQRSYTTQIGGKTFTVDQSTIVWDQVKHTYPFSNTLIMRLMGPDATVLFEREYYSPGGGSFSGKASRLRIAASPSIPMATWRLSSNWRGIVRKTLMKSCWKMKRPF